jgi:non-lysosomal glucosylceramidase
MTQEKSSNIDRRTFLKLVSAGTATMTSGSAVMTQGAEATNEPTGACTRGSDRADRVIYKGENLRSVAMPLGGIGTGVIALAGDGGLRQWQIVNNVDHVAHVPHSFFACWARPKQADENCLGCGPHPSVARVLQSSALYDQSSFKPPMTTNDHHVPPESRKLLGLLPGVKSLEYVGEYPIAQIRYADADLPAELSLEAYSPFVPLNSKDSGLPAIIFDFKIKNPRSYALRASLSATLQNLVGWDGHSPIVGVEYFAYGSNRNVLKRSQGLTAIDMSNPRLPKDFPFQGHVVLAALTEAASYVTQWDNLEQLWREFSEDGKLPNLEGEEASVPGRTWNGALAVPVVLEPGEEKNVAFLIAWHFPNRFLDWSQPAVDKRTKFWLGTMYANWFGDAFEVVRYVQENFPRLADETHRFHDTLYSSTLPYTLLDSASSQASIIRTPTCIWVEDGNLYGFEGCCGASTTPCAGGGCCPLNCTHVWGYEQSLSRLFPDLERTMREIDLEVQQFPSGNIATRTALPLYLPRAWQKKPPAEDISCIDGTLSTVLKTYREYRQAGGRAWLTPQWPRVKKVMEYIINAFDPDSDGLLEGEQWTTYDIALYGVNSFIGILYLAALRAAEEMSHIVRDKEAARWFRGLYDKGRINLPAELWNGEYYIQKVDLTRYPKNQYATGCLSDQLLGQWWAHQLGLGHILPEDQVRTALRSILKYNWRDDFVGFKQAPRVFASDHDSGLLNCTWPKGGRPSVAERFPDEVWTGVEYEVAGLLLYEGMVEEALKILRGVRARYNGRERSPWNDVECGDHYARAMSSWTVVEGVSGLRYNADDRFLSFAPKTTPENFRCFFLTAHGWGTFDQKIRGQSQVDSLTAAYGRVKLRTLELIYQAQGMPKNVVATLEKTNLKLESRFADKTVRLVLADEVELKAGDSLQVEVS